MTLFGVSYLHVCVCCDWSHIYFKATQQKTILKGSEYAEYFEVENYNLNIAQDKPAKKAKKEIAENMFGTEGQIKAWPRR